jgi:2-oxoglutarate ferredoxin oxidoreductase subunit alpha
MHARMNDKRIRKILPLKQRRDLVAIEGPRDARLALVSWGSVAGVTSEAFRQATAEGLKVKLIVPRLLYPVPEQIYEEFFASVRRGLVVEQSHQGQLYRLLRMFVDVPRGVEPLCRSGSNPFLPEEIVARLREQSIAMQRERTVLGTES